MRILWLFVVCVVLVGCAKSGEQREYNPWLTVLRISTGNIK